MNTTLWQKKRQQPSLPKKTGKCCGDTALVAIFLTLSFDANSSDTIKLFRESVRAQMTAAGEEIALVQQQA